MNLNGSLITIEGGDGVGKETQSKLLAEHLEYVFGSCVRHSFPSYGTIPGAPVEAYLKGNVNNTKALTSMQISTLFAVDRMLTTINENWTGRMDNGTWFVSDRYTESNIIYQASKFYEKDRNYTNDLMYQIRNYEYSTLKIPKPDMVIYLHLDEEVSSRLIDSRDGEKDINEVNKEYMKTVHRVGLKIAKDEGWTIIDCTDYSTEELGILDIGTIEKAIWMAVCSKITESIQQVDINESSSSYNDITTKMADVFGQLYK